MEEATSNRRNVSPRPADHYQSASESQAPWNADSRARKRRWEPSHPQPRDADKTVLWLYAVGWMSLLVNFDV